MKSYAFVRLLSSRSAAALLIPLVLGTALSTVHATILPSPTVTNSATPFNPSFAASNAVDNTEFEYASQTFGVDTFLEFSFGTPQTFDKIVVLNRDSPGQSDLIANFTLTLDGGPLTSSVMRTPLRGSSGIHSLGGLFTATTVRLDVDTVGTGDTFNNTGAQEVLFVRTPTGQTPIATSILDSATAFNPFFAAENAVDGVVGRSSAPSGDGPEYASMSLGSNAFVDFDLGAQSLVGGFDFFDRIADEDRITGFDLIFSSDPVFGDVDDTVRSFTKSGLGASDVFATPVSARFVRFDVTANLGGPAANTGISEITFYQVPEPSTTALLSLGLLAASRRRRR